MKEIILDIETYCDLDLEECGARRYVSHPSFEIILCSWLDVDNPAEVYTWELGQPIPIFPSEAQFLAFNAAFEFEAFRASKVWPTISFEYFKDVQALCARYSFPKNLAQASQVLCPNEHKDSAGKSLIKLFSCPPRTRPDQALDKWKEYKQYNRQDVIATYNVYKALPRQDLSNLENEIYKLNQEINENGLPVDTETAKIILGNIDEYTARANDILSEITGSKVTSTKQVKRIKDYLFSIGLELPNLQAQTIEDTLKYEIPEQARQILELRAAGALSSVGKYKRILNMSCDGRMYYNSKYYGAHTGRITGTGFQMLNLPRAKTNDPEGLITQFKNGTVEDTLFSARKLVRAMIKAPEGSRLLCADYSSIEFILLVWLAGDKEAVKSFAKGEDQYKVLAAHMYNTTYDKVTKDQRQVAKYGILGCGYGMGAKRCIAYTKQFGKETSLKEATFIVESYRNKYPKVKNMWYALNSFAITALQNKEKIIMADEYKCKFRYSVVNQRDYLLLQLPSGRVMYYSQPKLVPGQFGYSVHVTGMNQVTKQWVSRAVTPGTWAENIIQAIARDLLYHGKFALRNAGYKIIASIYDEVLCEMPNGKGSLEELCQLMCALPTWAQGLPLRADGWEGNRYRKE